jgi:hypothetical protein
VGSLKLILGLENDECDGNRIDPERVIGLSSAELAEIRTLLPPGTTVSTEPSSVGKGASGPGTALIIATTVANDGASLLAWGSAIWAVIRHLRTKRVGRRISLDDPRTMAAAAIAQVPALQNRFPGTTWRGTFCLTGATPGMGTDERDVWVASFSSANGWVLALFVSPNGMLLGQSIVPAAWDPSTNNRRDQNDITRLFTAAQVT